MRDKSVHAVVNDTIRVYVSDTTHVVHQRDTTIVNHREVIHERIETIYDPQTGNPTSQTIDRDVTRLLDSLSTHLRDSILHALIIHAEASHGDSIHAEDNQATGSPARQQSVNIVSCICLWACLLLVLYLMCILSKSKR